MWEENFFNRDDLYHENYLMGYFFPLPKLLIGSGTPWSDTNSTSGENSELPAYQTRGTYLMGYLGSYYNFAHFMLNDRNESFLDPGFQGNMWHLLGVLQTQDEANDFLMNYVI